MFIADAEKLDYDSDNGNRSKKKGMISGKVTSIGSQKRSARSPPPTNNKKKKR
jgi:hypothetical protein